jgi:hypothetical protein
MMGVEYGGSPDGSQRSAFDVGRRAASRGLRLISSTFADPDALVSRLGLAANCDAHVVDARVALLGFDTLVSSGLIGMLRQAGTKSCATCSDISQLRDISTMKGAFTHVIVNLDAFEDIDDAVSALLLFRARQKGMIVLLISDAVGQDDLFPDRKWICDATLCAPVSYRRLCDGLLAAWTNNKAFNS